MKRGNYRLRELKNYTYQEAPLPAEFQLFFEEELRPLLKLEGYKLAVKRRVAVNAANLLIMTGLADECVSDPRNKRDRGARMRIAAWDALLNAGLAVVCLGSEQSGRVSRYAATDELLRMREVWFLKLLLDIRLARNTDNLDAATDRALVCLRAGRFDPVTWKVNEDRRRPIPFNEYIETHAQPGPDGRPDPRAIRNGLEYLRGVETEINRINTMNLSHNWQATNSRGHSFQPNVCLRQVHVGELFRLTRLYSWSPLSGQLLPKDVRRNIVIDGEPAAELDYSGLHTRMLYHFANLDPSGDVYQPEEVFPRWHALQEADDEGRAMVRRFVKRATNVCWCVRRRELAHSAIGRLLAEHPERLMGHVVYEVENSGPVDIVDRLMRVHEPIRHRFFSEYGFKLMTVDSQIMMAILKRFTDANKPVLAVHDSVVCRRSDVEGARIVMTDEYFNFMQFDPVIKREF